MPREERRRLTVMSLALPEGAHFLSFTLCFWHRFILIRPAFAEERTES
jgi:hypothetical protein